MPEASLGTTSVKPHFCDKKTKLKRQRRLSIVEWNDIGWVLYSALSESELNTMSLGVFIQSRGHQNHNFYLMTSLRSRRQQGIVWQSTPPKKVTLLSRGGWKCSVWCFNWGVVGGAGIGSYKTSGFREYSSVARPPCFPSRGSTEAEEA